MDFRDEQNQVVCTTCVCTTCVTCDPTLIQLINNTYLIAYLLLRHMCVALLVPSFTVARANTTASPSVLPRLDRDFVSSLQDLQIA